jgi:hypothetical protein
MLERWKSRQTLCLWALLLGCAVVLQGCGASARPYGVPLMASLVGEAAGKSASFTAPHDGSVWVAGPGHPGQERYIVYSGWIRAGQAIVVDPAARSISVGGEQQKVTIDSGNSYYQIWFEASSD